MAAQNLSPAPPHALPAFGLYLHIPFCVKKCSYCAFSSSAGRSQLVAPYLEAIHSEIGSYSGSVLRGRLVTSIFVGGGTPSVLSPEAVAALLTRCRQVFRVTSDAEITLEANPETVTHARLQGYFDAGVNRISMGVQSLDAEELVQLGRPHSATRVITAYQAIRDAGFRNVNIDLLYGVPGQTAASWRQTLAHALDLAPDHVSAYALTPEPRTPIGEAVASGDLVLPDESLVEEQETALLEALSAAGLHRYEVSNYAKPHSECRHNRLYWQCDDWLGLGASAHSHLAGTRWWNHFEAAEYIAGIRAGSGRAGCEVLSLHERIGEAFAFGLRMIEGVSRTRFSQRFGPDAWRGRGPGFARLAAAGLLEEHGDRIRLTARGLDLADSVAVTLV